MRIQAALIASMICAVPVSLSAQQVTVVGKKDNPREGREDKISCKTYTVTGSLARTKRVCMSGSDWRQQRADILMLGNDRSTGCSSPGGCQEQPGASGPR